MNTGDECSQRRELPLDSVRDVPRQLEHLADLPTTQRRFAKLFGQAVHPSFGRCRFLRACASRAVFRISDHVVPSGLLDA